MIRLLIMNTHHHELRWMLAPDVWHQNLKTRQIHSGSLANTISALTLPLGSRHGGRQMYHRHCQRSSRRNCRNWFESRDRRHRHWIATTMTDFCDHHSSSGTVDMPPRWCEMYWHWKHYVVHSVLSRPKGEFDPSWATNWKNTITSSSMCIIITFEIQQLLLLFIITSSIIIFRVRHIELN